MRLQLLGLAALVAGALALQAPRPPATPIIQRGACPFECCRLGDWTTTEPLRVYARERDTGAPVFTIPAGQSIKADTANFYTLRLGVIVARKPFSVWDHIDKDAESPPKTRADSQRIAALRRPLAKGDTLYHIGQETEMGDVVWLRGYTAVIANAWAEPEMPDPEAPAVAVRPIQQEWWVRVTYRGRVGWVQVWKHVPDGADGCA